MPERNQDHGAVTMTITVGAGRLPQTVNLCLSQIFPRAQFGVGFTSRRRDFPKTAVGAMSFRFAFAI